MAALSAHEKIAEAGDLNALLAPLTLQERLLLVESRVEGPIVFTTSFGLEDQVLTHAIYDAGSRATIVTLDTGRLHPETYDVWDATEAAYGVRIPAFTPDRVFLEPFISREGLNGFRRAVSIRQSCCAIRKVEPLQRALTDATAWITGLRAGQSAGRAETPLAEADVGRGLIKLSLLADWSRSDVERYVADHAVPYNALHDRGYPSIGCAPCTRAVRVGEPERAGRWWWEQEAKKECGLHVPAGSQLSEHVDGVLEGVA
jgi:phosphoadenosine phosphosulfate reductase